VTLRVSQLTPLKKSRIEITKGEGFEWKRNTCATYLTAEAKSSDVENEGSSRFPTWLLLQNDCSIAPYSTWWSSALWHGPFDPVSWLGALDMTNLSQVVSLIEETHLMVPSNISWVVKQGRGREHRLMTAVSPAYKSCVRIFLGWGKVQCTRVVTCLLSQTSSCISSVKYVDRRDFQRRTPMVDVFDGIAFLMWLCSLQIVLDATNGLLGHSDGIRAKDCFLIRLI
jgi:hypothetical protein